MAKHIHEWERFELREGRINRQDADGEWDWVFDGRVWYVGYRCKCGEIGYELRLAA